VTLAVGGGTGDAGVAAPAGSLAPAGRQPALVSAGQLWGRLPGRRLLRRRFLRNFPRGSFRRCNFRRCNVQRPDFLRRDFLGWTLATLLLACTLSGCSRTRFLYDHLDWFVDWELGDFVELTPAQHQRFDRHFAALWRWHRRTQLPAYAALLRGVAADSAGSMSSGQIDGIAARMETLARTAVRRTVAEAAPVLAGLDDRQVHDLLAELDRRSAKVTARHEHLSDARWRRKQTEALTDEIDDWTGSVTREQREAAAAWIATLPRSPDPLQRRVASEWREALGALLARRREADFAAALERLFIDPQLPDSTAIEQRNQAQAAQSVAFFSRLSAQLTERQRKHFQRRLLSLATDFDTLAAEPVSR
jgi:hypothetical protein